MVVSLGPRGSAFALALLVGVGPVTAEARPCPVDPEVGPSQAGRASTEERIDYLEARVERGAYLSRAWAVGWGVSLGLLAVGQAGIAPFAPSEQRPEWWVGAGASTVGVLTRSIFVPRVLRERRRLARDASTGCERVAALEGALARSARWEKQGRGLLMHGLSLGFNAGVGLVLGLAFNRPVAGNRLASLGAVIGEVMIITQPQYMSRTLTDYRAGTAFTARFAPRPWVTVGGGGVVVQGRI